MDRASKRYDAKYLRLKIDIETSGLMYKKWMNGKCTMFHLNEDKTGRVDTV